MRTTIQRSRERTVFHFAVTTRRVARMLLMLAAFGLMGSIREASAQSFGALHNFAGPDGVFPQSALIQASDGNFYGTTTGIGGSDANGTVFKIDAAGNVTTLHVFGTTLYDGAHPMAALLQASDGNFYGTTNKGGINGYGTIFKIDAFGHATILHAFGDPNTPNDGQYPQAALIQARDGNFYGTTDQGGAHSDGTAFKMDPFGHVTILHSFGDSGTSNDGQNPMGSLIQANDGNFYGTTSQGGANKTGHSAGLGTAFKMDASGNVTVLHSFGASNSDGQFPASALIQATDGNFYGATPAGGMNSTGTLFKMDGSGNVTVLHACGATSSHDGLYPQTPLLQASDGNFYGTTPQGGANGDGTAFKIVSSGTFSLLHSFGDPGTPHDGQTPKAALIQAKDGNLYGTTYYGGANGSTTQTFGTAFKMDSSGNIALIHSFGAPNFSDGRIPESTLIQAKDGNFYGTTYYGGANNNNGTAFKMDAFGHVTILHSFGDPNTLNDGQSPVAALIQASDGNFYGTTQLGGANNYGTVFKMDSSGTVTVLHSFSSANGDGQSPVAALIQAKDGYFYGTTQYGGSYGVADSHSGTVFRMDRSGHVTVLHSFGASNSDAYWPTAALFQASDGNFYSTTSGGGAYNGGTAFKMDASGKTMLLHSFSDPNMLHDGQNPQAALIQATDANFYGLTTAGGANGFGVAFKMDGSGKVTILHSFGDPNTLNDGEYPRGALIQAADGSFYGATTGGGANLAYVGYSYGTVFRMDASGNVTVLHSFGATINDGQVPAGLVQAANHSLYGICAQGGQGGEGQVFRIKRGAGLDANNDGFSDILFQNTGTGDVVAWEMNGLNILQQGLVAPKLAPQWQLGGAGDFNGDGRSDALWRNSATGDVTYWELSGFSIANQGYLFKALPLVWQVTGVGDFNGDCRSDLLWRNTATGDVVMWEMNALSIQASALVFPGLPLQWQVAGVGDFNGDGMADLLWRNTQTGDVVMWEMDGTTIVNQSVLATGLPLVWQVAGIGDFNGDGMDDVLWRNTKTGDVVIWEMDGASILAEGVVATALPLVWQVGGIGDFNGDGFADVLWRNTATGDLVAWEMNGLTIGSQGTLYHALPLVWQVLAP